MKPDRVFDRSNGKKSVDLSDQGILLQLLKKNGKMVKKVPLEDSRSLPFSLHSKTIMEAEMSEDEVKSNSNENISTKKVKKRKPGIVYLGTLPPFMNVTKVKDIFSQYGELGRIFLQPAETKTGSSNKKHKKPPIHFSEGWIEFKSKRVAKEVALNLNNCQIGGKKSSKFYDYMWNIKYLPRFKWVHLSERLAYEKAVHKQKLRAEIAQAKREANFFAFNLEKSKNAKNKNSGVVVSNEFKQRLTENEIVSLKAEKEKDENNRKEFLKSLFAKS